MNDAIHGLTMIRDGSVLTKPHKQRIAREALLYIEKLKREKEDLRMFCKGQANNTLEMLKL